MSDVPKIGFATEDGEFVAFADLFGCRDETPGRVGGCSTCDEVHPLYGPSDARVCWACGLRLDFWSGEEPGNER